MKNNIWAGALTFGMALFVISVFCVPAVARETAPRFNSEYYKKLFIEYLQLRSEKNITTEDSRYYGVMVNLLYEFKHARNKKQLSDLVSLFQYNLGEGGNEIVECIILEKKDRTRTLLKIELTKPPQECSRLFGLEAKSCFNLNAYKSRAQFLIERMDKHEKCTEE